MFCSIHLLLKEVSHDPVRHDKNASFLKTSFNLVEFYG